MPGDLLNRLFEEGDRQDADAGETWTTFGEAVKASVEHLSAAYEKNIRGREKNAHLTGPDKPANVELIHW